MSAAANPKISRRLTGGIRPGTWLKAFVLKRILSARLTAPKVQLTSRSAGEPEVIKVPTRHRPVRCYVYRAHPDAPLAAGGATPPVYVNIHGGGFILTNPRQDDHLANYLAAEVGVTVVSVDYSTAPEVRYPVAEEQCFDVLSWVARSGAAMGWDDTRIGIGGGSAGANLAFAALHLAHQAGGPAVTVAVTVVPFVDATLAPEHYRSTRAKPAIDAKTMRIIHDTYFVDAARRAEPLASPAFDPDLADALPPLLVLVGEEDTLAPQGRSIVERLLAEGAPVSFREFEGQDHDWFVLDSTPEAVMRETIQLIGDHVQQHLQPEHLQPR